MSNRTSIPSTASHAKLRVQAVAQDLTVGVFRLTETLPRGYADLRDQARRASHAVVRNIAEGAGRFAPGDKRARYRIALGELAECDACLDTLALLGLLGPAERQRLARLAGRVGRMVTGLVLAQERRLE